MARRDNEIRIEGKPVQQGPTDHALTDAGVRVSMDGAGATWTTSFIERLVAISQYRGCSNLQDIARRLLLASARESMNG